MSIAHGFDPNISPIYEDDNDMYHSVHFSSADTPRRSGQVANQTMGNSRMISNLSGDFHNFHRECAPETSEIFEEEDDVVENSDENVPDSRAGILEDIENDEDENVPESIGFLADTFIVLSAGCCMPIQHHLSKKLKEMGAVVQKSVDATTTHIVVDRYANESIVGAAMARHPAPPLMVDIKWIQECLDNRKKCAETDYSMTGLRYLKQTCRRLSSFQEPSPEGELEETHWEDMENDAPTDPAELLVEIRKLSERLDALLDYVPVIKFEYHSPDCPTRQQPFRPQAAPKKPSNPWNMTPDAFRQLLNSISSGTEIRRRRSFSGFILDHRTPSDDAIEIQKTNRDGRETWDRKRKPGTKSKKAPQKTINDMRKTMAADLSTIRTTLAKNADLNRARTPKKTPKKAPKKPVIPQKIRPIRADDSDIQSALASLTITGNFQNTSSIQILAETSRRAPLVPTKSNVINSLQRVEDDDFISDVSAFIQENKSGRKPRNTEEEIEEMKNEVVFTGFQKDSPIEKKLKTIIRRFKLNVSTEINDSRTLCVVSRHGKRTMVVLKAICCDVPVVRSQWLEESFEDSQLLSPNDYIYDEWLHVKNNKVFENFHRKMWISPECVPDSNDLTWIVLKCGGKITRHLHKADLAIAPDTWQVPEIHSELEAVTPLFLIDSISMAELQCYKEYYCEENSEG